MRGWIVAPICAGLFVIAPACDDDNEGSGAGSIAGGGAGGPALDGGPGDAGDAGAGGSCALAASRLPVSAGLGSTPSIAWTGERYAVAWTDLEDAGGGIRLATL